ncbi:MAG TPA: site-specific integrase [Opitutaceae bacterium]|nr:site-specific integrase [Opitutaceae bacterium]
MPAVRKKLDSRYWFGCFTLPDGRRTQRSTKTANRREALQIASEWEEAARRRFTEAQARRVLSDIHELVHGAPLASPTVAGYVTQWLGRKQGETSGVTFKLYQHTANEFCTSLGDKAAQPIHYVTAGIVASWRDKTAAKSTPRTANNKLKIIRNLFQTAWRDGLITENPAAKVQTLKTVEGQRRPFTLDELKTLLSVASPEWRGMILAALYTGQRLKDIASLTWANVDLDRGEFRFATSKTGRRQVIPIARPLRRHLETLPAGDDPHAPLFPSAFRIATVNRDTSALSQQFHDVLVSAGLAAPRPPKWKPQGTGRESPRARSEVTFHSLRHTATSLLKNAGVSEAVARDIIGHESAAISRHYTHIDEGSKRKAIAMLPDVTALPTAKKPKA